MRLSERMPGSGGRLTAASEDFEVEEHLPYAPGGTGEHLFVRVEKRDLDTLEVARRLCAVFDLTEPGAPVPRELGIAGLKDRRAVARQWLSVPWPEDRSLPEPGPLDEAGQLTLLEAIRHTNKLRRGHVASNRFVIRIRDVPEGGLQRAQAILERLRTTGVPNPFGPQRFGMEGDNAERARAILSGKSRRPRDGRILKLLMSALQSEIFNRVLDARLEAALLGVPVLGDRMVKHASGGQFIVDDVDAERPRVEALEISPTGPLFGKKTPKTRGLAAEMEAKALDEAGLDAEQVRRIGPGGRRPLRYPLDPDASLEAAGPDSWRIRVTLPSGAYATSLLDELIQPEDGPLTRERSAPDDGPLSASLPETSSTPR